MTAIGPFSFDAPTIAACVFAATTVIAVFFIAWFFDHPTRKLDIQCHCGATILRNVVAASEADAVHIAGDLSALCPSCGTPASGVRVSSSAQSADAFPEAIDAVA